MTMFHLHPGMAYNIHTLLHYRNMQWFLSLLLFSSFEVNILYQVQTIACKYHRTFLTHSFPFLLILLPPTGAGVPEQLWTS
jgi:hypothetical protein